MIHGFKAIYTLDAASFTTFLAGVFTGQVILMILGGIASLAAIINHGQQIIERRKKKKE